MTTYQRNAILIATGVALLFLLLSLVTGNWKFFWFSLLPCFVSGMTAIFAGRKPANR